MARESLNGRFGVKAGCRTWRKVAGVVFDKRMAKRTVMKPVMVYGAES